MLPIKSDRNQEGCNPVSSNCVIWQGPDIPCIGLCKGDTVSDVIAKLASELCDILVLINVSTLDLSCFGPMCPKPVNIQELLQFIITKLCELQDCCDSETLPTNKTFIGATGDCPDCTVDISPAFYYRNELGDLVTRMPLVDYARAMGNKIYEIINNITTINNTLSFQQTQITYILNNFPSSMPDPITFSGTCLTDKIPVVPPGGIPIKDLVQAVEDAFCELRAATGMPSDLLAAIFKQCAALDTSPALNLPGVNMGSLPGWIPSREYSTVADSINNMWITICDMRAAISSILKNCCPQGCDGLVVNLVSVTLNHPPIIS